MNRELLKKFDIQTLPSIILVTGKDLINMKDIDQMKDLKKFLR